MEYLNICITHYTSLFDALYYSLLQKQDLWYVVCRVAQEASTPHREYVDRKKENAIKHL